MSAVPAARADVSRSGNAPAIKRNRARLLLLDATFGLVVGAAALVATPGLAPAAIAALSILGACLGSSLLGRHRPR